MSTIGSKWFGEGEKYAKAVFTLAGKIAPSVIFIDEVDRYAEYIYNFYSMLIFYKQYSWEKRSLGRARSNEED
jgi:hypothetical protein